MAKFTHIIKGMTYRASQPEGSKLFTWILLFSSLVVFVWQHQAEKARIIGSSMHR